MTGRPTDIAGRQSRMSRPSPRARRAARRFTSPVRCALYYCAVAASLAAAPAAAASDKVCRDFLSTDGLTTEFVSSHGALPAALTAVWACRMGACIVKLAHGGRPFFSVSVKNAETLQICTFHLAIKAMMPPPSAPDCTGTYNQYAIDLNARNPIRTVTASLSWMNKGDPPMSICDARLTTELDGLIIREYYFGPLLVSTHTSAWIPFAGETIYRD